MDEKERKLVKRSDKVAFFGNKSPEGEETFNRMRGFTTMSGAKNPTEYSRQYVDEEFETTDVVGFSPSIEFGFDQYLNDPVHEEMVEILDSEKTGTDARRNIVTVDFSKKTEDGKYVAVKREYAIIGDAEGDSMDAYTYSGTFRATGKRIEGTAETSENDSKATFEETKTIALSANKGVSFAKPNQTTETETKK